MTLPLSPFRSFSPEFIQQFEALRADLIQILIQVENYRTAAEEYRRSLKTLRNVRAERIPAGLTPINQMAVYLPYNNVLYSYILYGVVPSLLAQRVYIRPANPSADVAQQLHERLKPILNAPVYLSAWSRRDYLEQIIPHSEVVAFTGKFANLGEVSSALRRNQLLIYGGDGLVSFIIAPDADLPAAVRGAIADRLYASGQDCICPDVFLVQRGVLNAFLSQLTAALKPLRLGWHDDLEADYSPILKADVVERVRAFLAERQAGLVFGGEVDLAQRVIPPTVVLEPSLETYSFFEFYSPVFRVIPYDTPEELLRFYSLPFQRDLKMGVSVFGGAEIARRLRARRFVVAHNRTFFDIEDGNKPFGGYGVRASHTQMFGKVSPHPVLVSREVMRFMAERERRKNVG